jgi:predicted permease
MGTLISDLRYAIRELRKRPGFALTTILSLALGIGATSAVFSVVYAVLIDPFPYPGSDRIMELHLQDKAGNDRFSGLNGQQLEQLRHIDLFDSVVALDGWNLTTTDGDIPEDVQGSYLSPNAPDHWGIPALKGRWLVPEDAPFGQEPRPVVVIPYQFWQRYFMGDPNVVGRQIRLVHKKYEVVGVMPPRFKWGAADLYLPLKVTAEPNSYFGASLKLRPGVTVERANAELQTIMERFAKEAPTRFPDTFHVELKSIIDVYAKPLGPTLYLLLGAVASLLLIGCANVSILLLARGTERRHEFAVRAAVGADRAQLIRQLLTESLVIAVAGAGLGVLLAWRSLSLIIAWLPEDSLPAESVITMNLPVLYFSVGLAFATAIIFGLTPALQLSRPDIARLMQGSGRRVAGSASAKRLHGGLVATQVALTLVMLSAASAAGKGFVRMLNMDLGYDPHNKLTLPIPVHDNTHMSWQDRSQYFEQIRQKIAAMPEVINAGISTNATPPANGWDTEVEVFGAAASEKQTVLVNLVDANYFSILAIPLLQGRLWDRAETNRGATLAVINQSMARRFWPNGDAIGKQVRVPALKPDPPYAPSVAGADSWLQIIGVVADARDEGLRKPIKAAVYLPYTMHMWMFTQILVQKRVAPLSVLRDMRAQLITVDPDQQVTHVRDLQHWVTDQPEYGQQRLVASLFMIFSVLGLGLAALGLYSVVSYGVATRTNEFGIRIAMGAQAKDVFGIVLASTAVNVFAGLAAGIVLCVLFGNFAMKWVMESARDPLLLLGVTALLVITALLACLVPARRAASVDPMQALRYE